MNQDERTLKRYALYLLGRRLHATAEIRGKLERKIKDPLLRTGPKGIASGLRKGEERIKGEEVDSDGVNDNSEALVAHVIEYLISLDLLDDESFAKSYRASLERRGKSARYITQKLMQKGVPKEIIESLSHDDTVREADAIAHIIETHTRRDPDKLKTPQGRAKLTRHLAYRGFQFGDIRRAIEQVSAT